MFKFYYRWRLRLVEKRERALEKMPSVWRKEGWPEFYLWDVYYHNKGLLDEKRQYFAAKLGISAEQAKALT